MPTLMPRLLAVCLGLLAHAAPAADRVTSLPGWPGALPSAHYSGFLAVEHNGQPARVHYQMALSERSPATDPTLYWFNGGPPCSALVGAYTEVGPFRAVWADTAHGRMSQAVNLTANPFRWNTAANLVFIESPLGVGFSHYTAEEGSNHSAAAVAAAAKANDYSANDTSTAELNLRSLLAFFSEGGFPELAANPLFLAGESYAGIYVPLLAQQVLAHNAAAQSAAAVTTADVPPPTLHLNLQGILVGNGAVATGAWYEDGLAMQRMDTLREHALMPAALRARVASVCGNFTASPRSVACNDALRAVAAAAGTLNAYDIRETCLNASDDYALANNLGIAPDDKDDKDHKRGKRPAPEDAVLVHGAAADPCLDGSPMIAWLNQLETQTALHVATGQQGTWGDCGGSFGHPVSYKREPMDERVTVYPQLVGAMRVLVYNGDQDVCIPWVQDEAWTAALGATLGLEPQSSWKPWTVGGQVAGYETRWGDNLTFTTVKGAGHMVPEKQPERALSMLRCFLDNKGLACAAGRDEL